MIREENRYPQGHDSEHQETSPLLGGFGAEPSDQVGQRESAWHEVRLLFQQSPPLIVTYLFQFFHYILTTVIAGHLGADELAAASIGATTIAIFGSCFVEGMATALDTLCSQTYGSGNARGVGLHIQRMVLLMASVCIPIGALWFYSPTLLPFAVKQPELAARAGSFLRFSIIGLPAQAFYEATKRFLQVQGDYRTAMIVIVACTPINALLSWLFAFKLGMGLDGAALGSSLSQVLRAALLVLYIIFLAPQTHHCWDGFSIEAFRNWGSMAKLSFAGSIAVLSEYAAFEILTFSTSYLSKEHLAAQSILTTISIVAWHIPFSVSIVVSTRIGHLIGAGLIKQARHAATIHAWAFLAVGCSTAFTTVLLRHQLPQLFTQDPDVLAICAQTIVAVSAMQVAESLMCGTNGILRGLGRQSFAAFTVLIVNYLAAVPISMWLELGSPHWGLLGFWLGLPSGMIVIVLIQGIYLKLVNWGTQSVSSS